VAGQLFERKTDRRQLMEREFSDEFVELFEQLGEGTLDESGHAKLVAMVREDPALLEAMRDHFVITGALAELERREPDYVQRTAAHVIQVAGEAEDAFARRVTRRIVQRRIVAAVAVAALVALALLPLLLRSGTKSADAGPVVATLVRMDAAGEIASREKVRAGSQLHESSGWIRMEFKNGAVIAVEAPADLTVVSGMEIALDRGRLNGWCPESAHGFRVHTASASLTDLG